MNYPSNMVAGSCPNTQILNILLTSLGALQFTKAKNRTYGGIALYIIWAIFWVFFIWILCRNEIYPVAYILVYGSIAMTIILFAYLTLSVHGKTADDENKSS